MLLEKEYICDIKNMLGGLQAPPHNREEKGGKGFSVSVVLPTT